MTYPPPGYGGDFVPKQHSFPGASEPRPLTCISVPLTWMYLSFPSKSVLISKETVATVLKALRHLFWASREYLETSKPRTAAERIWLTCQEKKENSENTHTHTHTPSRTHTTWDTHTFLPGYKENCFRTHLICCKNCPMSTLGSPKHLPTYSHTLQIFFITFHSQRQPLASTIEVTVSGKLAFQCKGQIYSLFL